MKYYIIPLELIHNIRRLKRKLMRSEIFHIHRESMLAAGDVNSIEHLKNPLMDIIN